MKPRLNPCLAAPDAMKAVAALNTYVQGSGLEPSLDELIKDARIANQRLCLLLAHAPARKARAKSGFTCSMRGASHALHRSRARGAGLDRGSDIGVANPCAG